MIDLVLVGYDPEHTRRALAFCDRTFGSLPVRNRVLLANSQSVAELAFKGWTVVPGSNSLGEFSGWQEALDGIRTRGPATTTLFANDTLSVFSNLSILKRSALRHEIRELRGVQWTGFPNALPPPKRELIISGLVVPRWVSTYCFVLTAAALERLEWRLYDIDQLRACVAGGTDEQAFFSEQVSPDLRRHLIWWLFHGGWRRSQPLEASNADRLAFKARCICAEFMLSARCLKLGIALREPLKGNSWAARMQRLLTKVRRTA